MKGSGCVVVSHEWTRSALHPCASEKVTFPFDSQCARRKATRDVTYSYAIRDESCVFHWPACLVLEPGGDCIGTHLFNFCSLHDLSSCGFSRLVSDNGRNVRRVWSVQRHRNKGVYVCAPLSV